MIKLSACLFVLLCLMSSAVQGRTLPDIPISDPTYRYLEQLVACRWIDSINYGQRPFSGTQVLRFIAEAREKMAGAATGTGATVCRPIGEDALRWLDVRYDALLQEPTQTFQAFPFAIDLSSSGSTHAPRSALNDNGLGLVNLRAAPLQIFREGRDYPAASAGMFLEGSIGLMASPYLSATVQPRAWIDGAGATNATPLHATLWEAQAKLGTDRVALAVGRQRTLWGPAEHGGLLLTDHSPPLDMVRLHTPIPFQLPWIFRYIGPIKIELLVADLGRRYTPAHTFLSGWRFDIKPHRYVTVGLNHAVMLRGEGLPKPTWMEGLVEFIGVVKPGYGNAASNHQVGIDLHIRIPPWRGTQVYAAYAYEDPDSALEIQFDRQAAWMIGTYLPLLDRTGRWSARAEYWRAGSGFYRHGAYTDGWTLQGHGLANPFGGDSNSGLVMVSYLHRDRQWDMRLGIVHRKGDHYQNQFDASGDRIAVITDQIAPDEFSAHVLGRVECPLRDQWSGRLSAGYEHVWNRDFIAGQTQHNLVGEVGLVWRFLN